MADYDAGEITDRERKAAENQTATSSQNVADVRHQLDRQLENYALADIQNRNLAAVQRDQNSRKTSADRFEAQRDLQNAAIGLLGSMGGAMNGSSLGNLMTMLRDRNDKENNTYWAQHQVNQDQVDNALQDSLNQNVIARRDAMQSAEKAVRDIEGDWRANLNNINPNLFPGGSGAVGSTDEERHANDSFALWRPEDAREIHPEISGYVIPDRETSKLRSGVIGSGGYDKSDDVIAGRFLANSGGTDKGRNTIPAYVPPSWDQPYVPQGSRAGVTAPSEYGADMSGTRNRMQGNDYFSQMMNRFNGR